MSSSLSVGLGHEEALFLGPGEAHVRARAHGNSSREGDLGSLLICAIGNGLLGIGVGCTRWVGSVSWGGGGGGTRGRILSCRTQWHLHNVE